MTMYHWINCMALAYVPHYLLFQAVHSDHDSNRLNYRTCVSALSFHLATQCCKMLAIATLLPAESASPVSQLVVPVVDLIGLYYLVSRSHFNRDAFFKSCALIGIGWALSDALVLYLVPLWMDSRGMEFDWKFVFMGLSSNVNLFLCIGLAASFWLLRRTDLSKELFFINTASCLFYIFWPQVVHRVFDGDSLSFLALGLKAFLTVFVVVAAFVSKGLYTAQVELKKRS